MQVWSKSGRFMRFSRAGASHPDPFVSWKLQVFEVTQKLSMRQLFWSFQSCIEAEESRERKRGHWASWFQNFKYMETWFKDVWEAGHIGPFTALRTTAGLYILGMQRRENGWHHDGILVSNFAQDDFYMLRWSKAVAVLAWRLAVPSTAKCTLQPPYLTQDSRLTNESRAAFLSKVSYICTRSGASLEASTEWQWVDDIGNTCWRCHFSIKQICDSYAQNATASCQAFRSWAKRFSVAVMAV